MASILSVDNEKSSTMKRTTREGKQLTYEMVVMQQPERARACGSGAKSSADRRPVDPPPVVQLRIFEGEDRKDVTFSYNANFFLFTTLESARPIAQPRVQSSVPQPMPVLTGMPVAGMAYLDRPDPAGYFIFPDLSVRHEGKYRLSFNLYEEVKDPKDEDAKSPMSASEKAALGPMAPQAHAHFRLEVRSIPFTVFSAKKFPGLAESTNLSRVVADQGCRVRIRRDVRMRRREGKPGKSYDDHEDDYARSERYVTPDMYGKAQGPDRPRSVSNGKVHGSLHGSVHGNIDIATPYGTEQRRLSQQEMSYFNQQTYQQHPPPPVPIQPSQQSYTTSHLSFGGSSASHYQVPSLPPAPASTTQPSHTYMHNSNGYAYQAPPPPRPMSTQQSYGYTQNPAPPPPPQPQFSQTPMYADSGPDYRSMTDYRRSSMPVNPHQSYPSQPTTSYNQVDTRPHTMQPYYPPSLQQPASNPIASHNNVQSLPPLSTIQPSIEKKYEPPPPTSAGSLSASTMNQNYDVAVSKYGPYSSNPHPAAPTPIDTSRNNTKRPFGSVFDTSHISRPMHSGMRPSAIDQGREVPQIEAEDGTLEEEYDIMGIRKMLSYRRADGTRQMKKCPSPVSD